MIESAGKIRWLLTAMGIIGATLNALQIGLCFSFWIAGNIGWIIVNLRRRQMQEALLFFAYLVTAVIGFFTWGT